MTKDLYEIGEIPPVGEVPPRMHAQLTRPDRYGDPVTSIQDEVIDVPELGPHDALVMVMAAGVNFNNVWAARGVPVDVTKTQARWGEPTDFHIVGSDASGVVYAVGAEVTNVKVGDRVVVHAGQWDHDDPDVVAGRDPGLAGSFRVWGYDTCWGSFAQFCKVQAHQCLPKAEALTWEEAAAPTLTGATAYRMLFGWPPNTVQPGDVVLVWGGSGGLGSLAVQLVTNAGGRAVAVVSSPEKGEYAKSLGAVGYVNRKDFSHWGVPPKWDSPDWKGWFDGAKAFGKAVWDVLGERHQPAHRLRPPGRGHHPDVDLRVRPRRHGGHLRGHQRLRHDGGRPLPLVHAEALPGLAPVQRRTGGRLQRPGPRRQGPDHPRPHLLVRRVRARPSADGRRQAARGERRRSDQRPGSRSYGPSRIDSRS